MSITITVPNDDHVALRAMAKALEEIAVARGAATQGKQIGELNYRINIDTTQATAALEQLVQQAESDTTAQQVESLGQAVFSVNGVEMNSDPAPDVSITTDSTGTPWDERIHSASKVLNSDGTWRFRRKPKDMEEHAWAEFITDVLFDIKNDVESDDTEKQDDKQKITDETVAKLDALYESEPTVTPAGDDFHVDAGEVTEQEVVSIPAPPLPVPPVLTPAQEAGIAEVVAQATMTFPQVMQFLTERHGRITSAQVDDIIADMGLNSIMDLNTQPEHTGPFIARVKALLGE